MREDKQKIVEIISNMSGRYAPYNIFCDWVESMALAIQNACQVVHDDLWNKREKRYMEIINRYDEKERGMFPELFALLVNCFYDNISELLGEIYMELGCGNKNTGQFFTPFHISKLNAEIMLPMNMDEMQKIELSEPSVGGGGMIIAAAAVLKDRGINYQKVLEVTAQDLDWKGVYMTYVQLSILGIRATVVQGNTLIKSYHKGYARDRIFITPARMGMLI